MKHFLIFTFLLCSVMCTAQRKSRNLNDAPEVIQKPRTGHGIGVVASSTMGNGLAYRYWKNRFGYHMSFLPALSDDGGLVSWGNAFYYTIMDFQHNNKLILHAGMDYVYRKEERYFYGTGSRYSRWDSFNFGVGPGIETHSRYGSFTVYAGYGIYNRLSRDFGSDQRLLFLSGGVSYFFEI